MDEQMMHMMDKQSTFVFLVFWSLLSAHNLMLLTTLQ